MYYQTNEAIFWQFYFLFLSRRSWKLIYKFGTHALINWAGPWKNVSYVIFEQQRHRSACTSAQSDQHLCCSLLREYNISRFYSWNFKSVASFCGCTGWFVSGLVGNSRKHVLSCHGSIALSLLLLTIMWLLPHVYFNLEHVFRGSNQIPWKVNSLVSNPWMCWKSSLPICDKIAVIFFMNAFQRKYLTQILSRCAFFFTFLAPLLQNRKLLSWIFGIYRGFACEWLVGVFKWLENTILCIFS